jgi:hypothetical protein
MSKQTENGDLGRAFEPVRRALARHAWPGVEEGTSYGTPALRVKGKFMVRLKDSGTLVAMCTLDEKEMLMAAEPAIFFETEHYKGWPAVLVRLDAVDPERLASIVERAWRLQAPKRLLAAFEAERGTRPSGPA